MRRLTVGGIIALALLVAPTAPAAAETTVSTKGNVVTITIAVDVVGAKGKTGPDGTPLVDSWEKAINDTWGDAFSRLPYKSCFKFELKLKLKARGDDFDATTGRHRILVGAAASGGSFRGTGFEGAPETTRNPKTGDGTRSFEHDRDGFVPVNAPPTVVAHEFGHLMGLGDDRANGAPKGGRDGTMMVGGVPGVDPNVVQKVDQELIDRIGKAIEEALKKDGKKLPKCYAGEVTTNIVVSVPGSGTCSGFFAVDIGAVVGADDKITGQWTVTEAPANSCGGSTYAIVGTIVPLTGRAQADELLLDSYPHVDRTLIIHLRGTTGEATQSFTVTLNGITNQWDTTGELHCVTCEGERVG